MRNRPVRHRAACPLVVLAAAAALSPTYASAQTGQSTHRQSALEEVVVTAQRRETSLQSTPIAITAFTERQLTNLGVHDLSQMNGYSPSLSIGKQPSSNSNMGIFIRGVGEGETSLLTDPKVGVYIDGVFMSKTVGGVFDIVDLKRIEVLRGPQGTLFGRNTTGGAINVITVKPKGEWAVKAKATYGRFDSRRYGVTVDFPAFANIATQVSTNSYKTEGWAKNEYTGPPTAPAHTVAKNLASMNNKAWRVALRWTPTEAITVDYSYDRTNNSGVPAPYQVTKVKDYFYNGFTSIPRSYTYLGGPLYQDMAATVGNPHHRRKHYMLDGVTREWLDVKGQSLTAQWDLGNIKLKYIFGDRKTDSGYGSTDLDGGAYYVNDPNYGPGYTPGFHAAIPSGYIDMHSHEFQIIGNAFDSRLNYTGGLYYYKEKVYQNNPQTLSLPSVFVGGTTLGQTTRLPFPFPVPGADPNSNGLTDFIYGQDTESWAVYGQGTYAFTDQWSLTFGLRYTNDYKNAFLFNEGLKIGSTYQTSFAQRLNADHAWDNVSGVINLQWQITPAAMVYGKYTTGYNGGGYNSRATTVEGFVKPFNKEEVKSWEAGLKSEWFDQRLRFNAAAYYNDYTDIQVAQFEAGSGGASSKIVNAGEGTYWGTEFDITVIPIEGLTLNLNYGYLNAEYNTYLAQFPGSSTVDLRDISSVTTVPHAPKHTASFSADYEFPRMSFGYVSAHAGARYMSKVVFHPFQNQYDRSSDYTLVDARLSLNEIPIAGGDAGHLRISLWGKNLTDKEYRNWGIDFSSIGYAGDVFGEPRTYGIDLVYTYN